MGRKRKIKKQVSLGDDAARESAQEIMGRAQAAVEELSTQGVDVGALTERLSSALESLNTREYRAAEMAAGEIVVLAKAMREMAALSGDLAAQEESERATIVDAISMEVSRQVKDITRDIPMEIAKQVREATKRLPIELAQQVQENLGSYPTMDRTEDIASRRASQAAQDLLLSKEFEDKVAKLVAEAVEKLPNLTRSDVSSTAKEVMAETLDTFLGSKKFKKEVGELSREIVEDAKKPLEEALEDKPTRDELNKTIAELAGKEGLQQAISDLLKGDELAARVRTVLQDVPRLTPDDVTGIASGVASQAAKSALASDEWAERVKAIADETVSRFGETIDQSITSLTEGLLKGDALDEKVRSVGGDMLTEFREDLKHSVLEEVGPAVTATIMSEGFAGRVGELIDEKTRAAAGSAVDEIRSAVEELKAHAPEDALEEAKKAAKAEVAETVSSERFLEVVKEAIKRSGGADLDEERVVELARAQVLEVQESNPPPLDEEKLVGVVWGQLLKAFEGEEFKKAAAEAGGTGMEEKIGELVKEAVAEKLGSGLDPAMLENVLRQAAPAAVKEIAKSDEFKKTLDDKFRLIMRFLTEDVIPKTVKKLTGG